MQADSPTDPSRVLTSSSGTSTTTTRGLPAAAGAGGVDGAATAVAVGAVVTVDACRGSAAVATCCVSTAVAARSGSVAATTCCGFDAAAAPREPSLTTVAVLPAARDALDERRLVGATASALSTLAGARGARWAPSSERESKKS
jgi:hypothetical protein